MIAITASVVVTFILELILPGGIRVHPVVKAAREVKSSILLFSFVPFVLHMTHNLIAVSYSKDHSFWQVLSIVAFVWINAVYAKKIIKIGTSVSQINFLHGRQVYQKGKIEVEEGIDWVFDTYIDMNTKTVFRQLELLLFFLILITYAFSYTADIGAAIALLVFYGLLFLGSLQTFFGYDTNTNERKLQKKLLLLSMIHMLL